MRNIYSKSFAFLLGRLTFAVLVVSGLTSPSSVYAASATATGTADIVTAIAISKDTGGDLGFGYAVASATAGTVVVDTAGSRSCTAGTTCVSGGTVSAADFTVTGQGGYTYAVTLPSSATLSDGATTPNTMTVGSFTSNPASTGTLSASGSQALKVGATLNVGVSQVAGTYTGNFSVSVDYN